VSEPKYIDLFGLVWRECEVKSTLMLQSRSNAPYLNRNNYLYGLACHLDPIGASVRAGPKRLLPE